MGKKDYLIWMDLEMTGLNVEKDRIIEIATVITNTNLEIVDNGPVLAIYQELEILDDMSDWSREHHDRSGLTEKVKKSTISQTAAEDQTYEFIRNYATKDEAPLCGNSIHQDRRFLARYMPKIDQYLHYRNIDVSSIKELVYRWYPNLAKFEKTNQHTALEDIYESVAELKYYREKVFLNSSVL
jgi:oligoribonuclease